MKTTILTIATIGLLFTSCTKEDDCQPVNNNSKGSLCGEILDVDSGGLMTLDGISVEYWNVAIVNENNYVVVGISTDTLIHEQYQNVEHACVQLIN